MVPPGGQSGDEDPAGVDGVIADDLAGDCGNDRRFPGTGGLVLGLEPVPHPGGIGGARLLGVGNQETMPIRQLVHRGACRKIGGVLTSAVQHDDQWEGNPGGGSGRDVEVIVPGSSGTDMPYPATSARTDPMVSRSVGGFDNAYQGVLLTIR